MKWDGDLPETWRDAPEDPPVVNGGEPVEMADTDEGVILRPEKDEIPPGAEGTQATRAVFSSKTVAVTEDAGTEVVSN